MLKSVPRGVPRGPEPRSTSPTVLIATKPTPVARMVSAIQVTTEMMRWRTHPVWAAIGARIDKAALTGI